MGKITALPEDSELRKRSLKEELEEIAERDIERALDELSKSKIFEDTPDSYTR